MKFAIAVGAVLLAMAAVPMVPTANAVQFSGVDFATLKSEDAAFSWSYDTAPSSQSCTITRPSASTVGPVDCATLTGFSSNALQRGLILTAYLVGEGAYELSVSAPLTTPQDASFTLIVDDTAPSLSLSGPSGLTNDNTPEVSYTASDGTIRCALDPPSTTPAQILGWSICGSGTLAPVSDGAHVLQAAAIDGAGNISVIQSLSFTVDTIPPAIDLQGIANGTVVPTPYPQYSLGSPDAVSLQCFYDNNPSITCQSISVSTVGLGDGPHTMHIVATDVAGNVATLVVSFTVNDSLPEGPTPKALSLKTGKVKNSGNRIKVSLAGAFKVSGDINWATACKGRVTILVTGKVGRKSKTYRARASLKRKGSGCVFNTTLTAPKVWKGKRLKTTVEFEGNNQLGSFSVTGKLRLRPAR